MSILPERWRPVIGYEGLYEVSDHGRVRSLDRRVKCYRGETRLAPGKILSLIGGMRGYSTVHLSKLGHVRLVAVHRLVAAAFIGECPVGYQVNHKNGQKTDNRLGNLEYVTPQENKRHSIDVLGDNRSRDRSGRYCAA